MAVKKGQRYLTNVVDLETGEVIYSADGLDTECLKPIFEKIKRYRKAKLEAIAVDMSSAYLKAIEFYAQAGVKIIHDRYHLVANMNRVLDESRRDEYRRKSGPEKGVMKGHAICYFQPSKTSTTMRKSLVALNPCWHSTRPSTKPIYSKEICVCFGSRIQNRKPSVLLKPGSDKLDL